MAGRGKKRKTKLRFPSFSQPLEIARRDFHIPTAPTAGIYIVPKEQHQTKEKEPGDAPTRLQPFRLIFTLENAPAMQDLQCKVEDFASSPELLQ